jgi:hypothetical protein
MKSFVTAIIVITGLFLTSYQATAESTPANPAATSSISGKVQDMQTGESLAGVKVILSGIGKTVYTDLEGKFSIENLTPGSYDITVSLISYDNSLIENLEVQPGHSEEITVKLNNQ